MGSSLYFLILKHFLFILFCFNLTKLAHSSSSLQQLCHDDESSALLQFKQSFFIKKHASDACSFAYPKVLTWSPEGENGNCCSWEGVECDDHTGHVIGLDLSCSFLYGSIYSNSTLFRLVHLQSLNLAGNHFNYSQIPSGIRHLSRLQSLNLSKSSFFGQIPLEILELPKLTILDLSVNVDRFSHSLLKLEEPSLRNLVENLTNLQVLNLSWVNISSTVPETMTNLSSLSSLSLRECGLFGNFPSAIFSLPNLRFLSIRFNPNITGYLPEFHRGSLLEDLRLAGTSFTGKLPESIGNLHHLIWLDIQNCSFSGPIPYSIGDLIKLTFLDLSENHFIGQIPSSLANLTQLNFLSLYFNNLNGAMEVEMFLMFKNLNFLELGANKLSLLTRGRGSINGTLPQFKYLGLSGCNLNEFPKFLQYQDQIEWLHLGDNNLRGHIPKWVWNISKKNLTTISLRENFLTGEIPPLICKLNSLSNLDLSSNYLNGTIPQCLSNFSDSLTIMLLQNNNFHGTIPQAYNIGSNLKVIDLSQNYLIGPVPRSLEILNLGNNQIYDTFPFWLGTIPEMKILALRSNQFHGEIEGPLSKFNFPKLRIIDISWNAFAGELPLKYFKIWNDMKVQEDIGKSKYAETSIKQLAGSNIMPLNFGYSMRIMNKGADMFYYKIQSNFKAIDFSGNKFKGNIPESIAVLKGLQLLNLSNNDLTGQIPTSLGNLTALESLDLSCNDLSGDIPQQLVQLTFLEVFNVSHNNLIGPIPQGKQFGTFENSSFDGNSGLCGEPLSKKCGNSVELPSPTSTFKDEDSDFLSKLDWIIISLGYLSGTVDGVVVGSFLVCKKIWKATEMEKGEKRWAKKLNLSNVFLFVDLRLCRLFGGDQKNFQSRLEFLLRIC